MLTTPRIITAAVAATVVLLLAPIASAGIKCWTNKEGFRECGNAVPPEYAQQGHTELNKQGVVVNEQVRAKTAEELAAEAAEQERMAKEDAEREKVAKEQAMRDRVLLDTFTTEEDLVLARDGKMQALDARIQHSQNVVDKLAESLQTLEEQAAKAELSGNAVPEKVKEDIARVKRQLSENQGFITLRQREKQEITRQFESDLARYRELKASN